MEAVNHFLRCLKGFRAQDAMTMERFDRGALHHQAVSAIDSLPN